MAPPKFGEQRRHRHDGQRRIAIDDEPAEEPAGLAAREKAPPRGGVAELGLEECDAEAEAAEDQRGRGWLAVEQHQRDQQRSGGEREPEKQDGRCGRPCAALAPAMLRWTWKETPIAVVVYGMHAIPNRFVPAKAGTQRDKFLDLWPWIPASAGMNGTDSVGGLYDPKPEHLLQVVPLGARGLRCGRCASAVHSTIEPS